MRIEPLIEKLSDRTLARMLFAAFQDRRPGEAIAATKMAFRRHGRVVPADCAALVTDGLVTDRDLRRRSHMPEIYLWA